MKVFNFWLCSTMSLAFAAVTLYCASHGIRSWQGVSMTLFWLVLAWIHARPEVS